MKVKLGILIFGLLLLWPGSSKADSIYLCDVATDKKFCVSDKEKKDVFNNASLSCEGEFYSGCTKKISAENLGAEAAGGNIYRMCKVTSGLSCYFTSQLSYINKISKCGTEVFPEAKIIYEDIVTCLADKEKAKIYIAEQKAKAEADAKAKAAADAEAKATKESTADDLQKMHCICTVPGNLVPDCKEFKSKVGDTKTISENCSNASSITCTPGSGECPVITTPSKPETIPGSTVDQLKQQANEKLNPMKFGTGSTGIIKLLGKAIGFLIFPIGALAMVMYLWAGVLWMTSAGNSERIEKAKTVAIWTTLAVVIILSSYVISKFVFDILSGGA